MIVARLGLLLAILQNSNANVCARSPARLLACGGGGDDDDGNSSDDSDDGGDGDCERTRFARSATK